MTEHRTMEGVWTPEFVARLLASTRYWLDVEDGTVYRASPEGGHQVWSGREWLPTGTIALWHLGDPQTGLDLESISEGRARAAVPEAFGLPAHRRPRRRGRRPAPTPRRVEPEPDGRLPGPGQLALLP